MKPALFLILASLGIGAARAEAPLEGRRTFDTVCAACHVNELSDAPQVRQPAKWASRLAKGREALYLSALNGFVGATGEEMPPRGGQPELTDAEVKAAVDYIIFTTTQKGNAP